MARLHVVAVGVAAQQDFGVGEFEAELFHRSLFTNRNLVVAVDQDVASGSRSETGRPAIPT